MSVGKNIKRLRLLKDLTQKQLGEKIGIGDKAISSWEIDRTEPDIGMIEKLCDVFECKKTDIIGEDLHKQYYLNEETARIAQDIYDNKDLRILFDAGRKASPEDLKLAQEILLRFKKNQGYEE